VVLFRSEPCNDRERCKIVILFQALKNDRYQLKQRDTIFRAGPGVDSVKAQLVREVLEFQPGRTHEAVVGYLPLRKGQHDRLGAVQYHSIFIASSPRM
jgi:hypothetical protein